MAQIPPAVCFEEKIPPEVWFNTPLPSQMEYAETKNEGVLNCPQCGISKADLRGQGGYCGITDPEGEEYNESISCPYNKYFAPQHWIEEPQVISHITPDEIILKPTLQVEVDMPPINQLKAGITKKLIPTYIFNRVNDLLPESVIGEQTPDGMNYNLTYYAMDEDAVNQVIESKEAQVNDIMFGADTRLCNCNVSMPRHSGVHPMTCVKCKLIIESEGFEAESFASDVYSCNCGGTLKPYSFCKDCDATPMENCACEVNHPKYEMNMVCDSCSKQFGAESKKKSNKTAKRQS